MTNIVYQLTMIFTKGHSMVLHMMLTFKILLVLGLIIPYLTYNVFYEISLVTNPLSHINSF